MADLKSHANSPVKAPTSVKAKKSSNIVSVLAPIFCLVLGYVIWRYVIGAPGNFTNPDPEGGFWPHHIGPTSDFARRYEGGIVVPVLIACLLIVVTFTIERWLTISRASGRGSNAEFVRKVQFYFVIS